MTTPDIAPVVSAGPPATPANRLAGRAAHREVRDELPRVRTAALAWRNGLAGLLAGLIGFGLIRGQNDIGQLAQPWAVVAGALLLFSLAAGTVGACFLMRAAHGRPAASIRKPQHLHVPMPDDHSEALQSAEALTWGVRMSLACTALLVAAVAVTWYGPSGTPGTPPGTARIHCGEFAITVVSQPNQIVEVTC